jgi:beta-glucosidase/6-phospho-beta-glucosidase/beta-galactosidase
VSERAPAPGADARAETLELDRGFVAATGIECSAPRIDGGIRVDELEKTGHYAHYERDFDLVVELGIRFLRYGMPFHRLNPASGKFDWSFPDRALDACRRRGIVPVVDLMHFGVPDDIGDYQSPALPERFRAYADAFAARYGWVRYYTPVNEPLITAAFSARRGLWNERRSDDASFVRALLNVARCVVVASDAIRAHRRDAIFIQSDSCEYHHPLHPDAIAVAAFENELRFVGFELVYGLEPAASVRDFLLANGARPADLDWFAAHGSRDGAICGNDYYARSEVELSADRSERRRRVRLGYYHLAKQYHERLGVPIMHAETNAEGAGAVDWLHEQWTDALRLRREGVPIRGFTWYGLVNHVDWDSALTRDEGRENACGLVDLNRRPNPAYHAYRELIETLGNVAVEASGQPVARIGDGEGSAS